MPEGTDARGLNFTISPELEEGEIRIVLTWSARPVDLDAHLEGTGSGGQSVDKMCIRDSFYLMQSNTIKATTKIMIVGSQIKKRFRD